jgi:hypothetical protein
MQEPCYTGVMADGPSLNLNSASIGAINRVVGIVGLVFGLAVLLGGGSWIHHSHLDAFLLKPAVAEGQVVENQRVDYYRHGTWTRTSYRAIVRFTDRNGQIVTLPDWIAFKPPAFFVGQSVKIFYDPQSPQAAMIDRGAKNYYLPILWCAFGGLSVFGSLQRLSSSRS